MSQLERATPYVGSAVVDALVDLVTAHGGALAVLELDGAIHRWSAGAEELSGYPAVEVVGRQLSDVTGLGLGDADGAEASLAGLGRVWSREHNLVSRDGRSVAVRTSATMIACDGSERILTASFPSDITAECTQLSRFEGSILEAARDGIWVTAIDGRTTYANTRMADLLDHPRDDLLGKPALDFLADPRAREEVRVHLGRRAAGESEQYELAVCGADGDIRWLQIAGSPVHDAKGVHVANLAVCADVTERKQMEGALSRMSLYDELTGLPNRALFQDRLAQLPRSRQQVGLILLDIDHFHTVNVRHRSTGGDLVLQSVASRLAEAARHGDTIARLGGDEFAVLCPESDPLVVRRVASDIIAVLEEPIVIDGHDVFLTASVGVALAGAGDVLRAASTAVCEAKTHGGARIAVYDEAMAARMQDRVALMADLRCALERNQLHLAYQPIVQLDTQQPVGMEALLRWTEPHRGSVSPAQFIPLAEDCGLMPRLGAWVLRQACRDAAALDPGDGKGEGIYVAVNLSAHQVADDGMIEVVRSALHDTGLAPHRLMLEITETAVISEKARVTQTLHALRQLGVRVAIDDFGTGYSSFDYLRQFPVDTIKIDRSFVARVDEDDDDRAIVASLLSLAAQLGVRVVAEGVETDEQLRVLRHLGCPLGQGFLWSPGVPAAELSEVLVRLRQSRPSQPVRRAARARSVQGVAVPAPRGIPDEVAGRIMALHSAGSSLNSIAAALNADGLYSPRGTRWHRNTVAHAIAERSFPGE
jgi:diguanylate cyclase (GGDEF)-like protein/PAS domain S-box-containing protein